ncbi:hypothetical protein KKD19_03840 [Patescibacteria group bacterium]|nr:hypothetical protein [Patescibacteria group bacterium]MBU4512341.1 hypothetical protein [Patescibacteria group bacterium]MCG2692539.1 hypothetical protein [Candidatus Parcubacteria bacterium]
MSEPAHSRSPEEKQVGTESKPEDSIIFPQKQTLVGPTIMIGWLKNCYCV